MKKCTYIVRALLTLGLFNAVVLGINPALQAAGTDAGAYEVIANAYGFGVDIPGCADASKNIREISIDELNIDVREMTTGLDVEYRTYGPGQAHWGNAKFTSAVAPNGRKELQLWWQEAAKGKNIRKNITVTLFKSDKTAGRSYTLFDCFPTQWSSVNFDTSSTVQTETLTVSIGHIEFDSASKEDPSTNSPPAFNVVSTAVADAAPVLFADAGTSDKFAQVRGFKVEIDGARAGKEVDTAWEAVSGSELIIELTETTVGSDKFRTSSPGHKSVGEIVLQGPITPDRKSLCRWINDTVNGNRWMRDLTITELLSVDGAVKDGKNYSYVWAYPIRYKFPRLSVTNRTGNMEEEIEFRLIRVEPELPPRLLGRIEIPDAPMASRGALVAGLQDLNLDVSRVEKTGTASEPTATIIVRNGYGAELRQWYLDAVGGKNIRKSITITLVNRGGREVRRYNLLDCFPISFDSGDYSPSGTTRVETIVVKMGRVELK